MLAVSDTGIGMMTVAVVDRLVHHATIFEMNVESYRRRAALERKRGRGRPPIHATNRGQCLIVAPRQYKSSIPLARHSRHDNHADAATPDSHPDCRRFSIHIAALQTILMRERVTA
jgi:hypothetical protein